MKAEFWHERWEADQLGFHQAETNPRLVAHWSDLRVAPGTPVFVPLCGKSLDMRWLAEQGHPVCGVELSPIACRDFFASVGVDPEITPHGSLERYEGGGYRIDCGDFFDVAADDLTHVGAVFDRGSLVALPPAMRRRYADHMATILPANSRTLLLTVEYDQSRMNGPPHAVDAAELEALYGSAFRLERLWRSELGEPPPRFRERGLDAMRECAWRLDRNA